MSKSRCNSDSCSAFPRNFSSLLQVDKGSFQRRWKKKHTTKKDHIKIVPAGSEYQLLESSQWKHTDYRKKKYQKDS